MNGEASRIAKKAAKEAAAETAEQIGAAANVMLEYARGLEVRLGRVEGLLANLLEKDDPKPAEAAVGV